MQLPVGEIASLGAASLWAVAVVMFRGPIAMWGARAINLFKCLFATGLLLLTVVLFGGLHDLAVAQPVHLGLLALSGVIGLTLGDTALFAAVSRIGAHRTLLMQTLAPVFAGLLAVSLGERLSLLQLVGAVAVLAGITLVVGFDRNVLLVHGSTTGGHPGLSQPGSQSRVGEVYGLALGVLAAFGQGTGVVIAKEGMTAIAVLPATLARLAAGSAGLLVVAALSSRLPSFVGAVVDPSTLRRAAPAAFLGTYLAMLLMMAGVALAPATIAAVLLSTSPIFSLGVEAAVDRRRPSAIAILGTLIAVVGVAVLTTAG
ncbi:MAG: DMT family transporter [Acidobacteriota bacterium]